LTFFNSASGAVSAAWTLHVAIIIVNKDRAKAFT
jgi:hypothetical protein